jgi:hypothetical protein
MVIGRSSNPVAMAGDRIIHFGVPLKKGKVLPGLFTMQPVPLWRTMRKRLVCFMSFFLSGGLNCFGLLPNNNIDILFSSEYCSRFQYLPSDDSY